MENRSRTLAICCATIIVALYVVGLVSGTELRHVVQTLPLWAGVILGFRRVQAVRWLALPMFIVWLFLMVLIWLYLLGWSHVVSGHFSSAEIAMTILIGVAAVAGIVTSFRGRREGSAAVAIVVFLVFAAIQVLALRLSFLPSIANR